MRLCALLLLLPFITPLFAATSAGISIQGTVKTDKGEPLPLATVAVQGTTLGAVCDEAGHYSLTLPRAGNYTLEARSLGYAPLVKAVAAQSNQVGIDFSLAEEPLETGEVVVTNSTDDPAVAIMRKAIARRAANEAVLSNFTADVYTKARGYDRAKKKTEYLAETFSTLTTVGGRRSEVVRQSRVSGDSRQYNAIGALFTTFSPYKSLQSIPAVFAREFVSPLAPSAFSFYQFKYLGNTKQNGQNIYKIQLMPRRAQDPVFQGTIYIADVSYAVKGLDWLVTKAQPLNLFDSLRLRQHYLPVQGAWLPFNSEIRASLKLNVVVQKIDAEGSLLSVFSNYRFPIGPLPPAPAAGPSPVAPALSAIAGRKAARQAAKALKKEAQAAPREILKVEPGVRNNSKNSNFWDSLRPTALSLADVKAFQEGDSLERRRNSPAYIDSSNRFKASNILGGYTYTRPRTQSSFTVDGPLSAVEFNTVEGYNVTLNLRYRWFLDSLRGRSFEVYARPRYGFAYRHVLGQGGFRWNLGNLHRERLLFEGGDYISEFSPAGLPALGIASQPLAQLDATVNSLYSLLNRQNYLKLFRQQGGVLRYYRRFFRDNVLDLSAESWHREPLGNRSDQSIFKVDRQYTANDQLLTRGRVGFYELPAHYATRLGFRLHLNANRSYLTLPEGLQYLPSPLPSLVLEYVLGNQHTEYLSPDNPAYHRTTYHSFRAQLAGGVDFKLVGQTSYQAQAGVMLSNGDVLLPDRFQVLGNETIYRQAQLARFGVLDYYRYNSQTQYAEQHLEHNFGGFIFNKVPLVRQLKLHEIVGIHAVQMPGLAPHTELLAGLTHFRISRISVLRLNYHWQVSGSGAPRQAFTFTLGAGL